MSIIIFLLIAYILSLLIFVSWTISDFRKNEYKKIKFKFDNEGFTKFTFK